MRIRDEELSAIPWEAALVGEEYLALRLATPIVRYVPAPEPPSRLSISGPVHVLGIISGPTDQAPLAVDEEKARLEKALEPLIKSGRLRLIWLEEATTPALQEALRRSVHVVHYIGHGDYDPENQEGELLFEDDSSTTSSVKASWLGTLLRDSGVRLAFLNACKTAHVADGVAEVLVRREVPAALGMQVSVRDDVAVAFSANFYAALADGWPVDAAVVEGRKAPLDNATSESIPDKTVLSNGVNVLNNDPDQPDWVHPVLYMRAPDGVLFG
ncbi:CHAT domain-containing protein [candidate division KSB1 bacterium]|nr:CHAT domain-containing protein [candidate division KSB1 bacterium]